MSFENTVRTDIQDKQEDSLKLSDNLESNILMNNESLNTFKGRKNIKNTVQWIKNLFEDFYSDVDKKVLVSEQDEADTYNTAKKVEENKFDEAITAVAKQASEECNECLLDSRSKLNDLHQQIADTLDVDAFVWKLPEDTSWFGWLSWNEWKLDPKNRINHDRPFNDIQTAREKREEQLRNT